MVFYVCSNCSTRSGAYEESLLHYQSCNVVRTMISSTTTSPLTSPSISINDTASNKSINSTSHGSTSKKFEERINSLRMNLNLFKKNLSVASAIPLPSSPALIIPTSSQRYAEEEKRS